MFRPIRSLAILALCTAIICGLACNGKDEGKPNPDLPVPEVPPGKANDAKSGPVGAKANPN